VHAAARLTWNAGLVLLLPDLRRNVKRAFNAAARSLAVTSSPLTRLRAALNTKQELLQRNRVIKRWAAD
jgi:hypothetical protein